MIISRTPVRITLGGGGTDLPEYSNRFGGMVISATINKYVYVIVKKHFENTIRFSGYHHKEAVNTVDEIGHPIVREALKMLNIGNGIEIAVLSDVPANVGLGTSSSFTVGLLNVLHAYRGDIQLKEQLAQEAITIERYILKEAGGIQDQYIAAYGGIQVINVNELDKVHIEPLYIATILKEVLESKLIFFYTNLQRNACEIQAKHISLISQDKITENLHNIKEIGILSKEYLEKGQLNKFGELLHEHWVAKRGMAGGVSTPQIDSWYQMALSAGATGGKLIGAGGGGFLMFYCPDGKDRIREILINEGLKEIAIRFEPTGSRVILHL